MMRALTHGLGACALVASLTACADGQGEDAAEGGNDALVDYTDCMRDAGVEDFPYIEQSEGGGIMIDGDIDPDDPVFQAAQAECAEYMEDARQEAEERLDPEERERREEAMVAFVECMRGEGIDMPDPDPDQGMGMGRGEDGMDPDDPAFQAALEECQDDDMVMRGPGRED
jgi:hypothetical protein